MHSDNLLGSPTKEQATNPLPRANRRKRSSESKASLSKKYHKIDNFFSTGQKGQRAKDVPSSLPKYMADLLVENSAETDYYSRLDELEKLDKQEAGLTENLKKLDNDRDLLKAQIRKELTTRLDSPGPNSLIPGNKMGIENVIKPMSDGSAFKYKFNLEHEIDEMILHRMTQSSSNEDFYFFQPCYKPQKYRITPKTVFKNWYRFLKHVDTPNDIMESGILLRKIRANPEERLPLTIWLWIVHNLPTSLALAYAREQYFEVLTSTYSKWESGNLLLAVFALFAIVGADPKVVSAVYTEISEKKIDPKAEDFLLTSYLPVMSTRHYYLPQTHVLDLVLDVVVEITSKNDTPELLLPTCTLVCLAAIDASLLYYHGLLKFGNYLSRLFNSVPTDLWEKSPESEFWRIAARLLCRAIPLSRPELRYRLIEVLSLDCSIRVHEFRHYLATLFFVHPSHPDEIPPPCCFNSTDIDQVIVKSILPVFTDNAFFNDPLVTTRLQYLQHALHHFSNISVENRTKLLGFLEPQLLKFRRSLRLQTPHILVRVAILDNLVTSIKDSMPIYDVYAKEDQVEI